MRHISRLRGAYNLLDGSAKGYERRGAVLSSSRRLGLGFGLG